MIELPICPSCCLSSISEKVESKSRTKDKLLTVIKWLSGFNEEELNQMIEQKATFSDFFKEVKLHPNAMQIKGVICGYRIENIENELTRKVKCLDKLIDELAKGKVMEKILRQ